MLEGTYKKFLTGIADQAVNKKISRPDIALAIGFADRMNPVILAVPQRPGTPQSKPRVVPRENRDQMDNLKSLLPLSALDFPYEGGGF